MRLEIASREMDAIGIALIVIGLVLLCGTLIFARRSSPAEPDNDEAEHNKPDEYHTSQGSDTPRRGGHAHSAIEATPDVRQRNERSPQMRNERD